MAREQAKELLPIIQAYADGKDIQQRRGEEDKWKDIDTIHCLGLMETPSNYHIKPEPKYRPFKTKEECWNEMLKHQPFSYITDYLGNITQVNGLQLDVFNELFISVSCSPCIFETNYIYDKYKFIDGTPFGIKEE